MGVLLDEPRVMRDVLDYGFVAGKVRVLSSRSLDRSTFERLIDAPSFAEQKRILGESVYASHLEHAHTPADVEAALSASLGEFYDLLESAGLPEPLVRFARVRRDYVNLKAALRARVLGTTMAGLLVAHGVVEPSAFEGDLSRLPAPLGGVAAKLTARIEAGEDSRDELLATVDHTVDAAMYADLADCAARSRSDFLAELARRLVDVANAKTVLRARRSNEPAAAVRAQLFDGGATPADKLMSLYAQSPDDIAEAISRTPAFRGVAAELLSDPSTLDVAGGDAIVGELKTARLAGPGSTPIVAFAVAREVEVQALRGVLLGKLAGLDADTLHRRLRQNHR